MEIAPERDLNIVWEPISLLIKNNPSPESAHHAPLVWTYGLLRVLESVRATDGEARVGDLYVEYGRRIHHDRELEWDVALALDAVGLDPSHAAAFSDEQWDAEITTRMNAGLALVGNDVGTPIISIRGDDGNEVALFGPVITGVPPLKDSLALWDSFVMLAQLDGFWEIKRTRTTGPKPGDRP